MEFINFNKSIKQQFARMCEQPVLFRSRVPGSKIWDTYLSSLTPDVNPVFRDPNSSEHNCNHDKNFMNRYGNIIAIIDGEIITLFDNVETTSPYFQAAQNCKTRLVESVIENVFVESYDTLNRLLNYESTNKTQAEYKLGFEKSLKRYTEEEAGKFGVVTPGIVYTFYHFNVTLPKKFVDFSAYSIESIQSVHRSSKEVFKRGLDEISLDTLILVRDLIIQGSLLNGDSYLSKLQAFIEFKTEYNTLPEYQRDRWCWIKSYNLPFAKFRNELIGTLCVELTQGEELNNAVLTWNKRVDPANYMKATAPISQKQIAEAKKFVEDNGYMESFDRRFATLDDINVSEICHQNVATAVKTASLFDKVTPSTSTQHKRSQFDGIEEVSIDKFMKDILPTCTSVEMFFENRFGGNLVALHTANNPDSKKAFKWSNNFGWTYNGNLAGKSQLAQMVQAKGGRVDGVFRFTHSWNELESNKSLMDLHVFMPGCTLPKQNSGGPDVHGRRVGWNQRKDSLSGGIQDVDYTDEAPIGYIPVENITFPDINKMPEGDYVCKIHNWSFRGTGGRGKAEIECGGQVYQYEYPKTKHHEWVDVATVTLKNGQFTIEHHLPETSSSKKMWNLDTNQFHKVNLVCLSPNFWGENNTGNKHYMFMLENCKSDTSLRSFHTEFLNSELLEHRKVMEVLGETTKLEPSAKHLCGLGFNATVKDSLILKLSGSHKRTIKITF